jgi:flavin reductase (DIM6/NTAB) family NADH-FMN oxidoreductase RutF
VGLTASSFNSVSMDPPLILWSLSNRSPSLAAFREGSHFAVNVLADEQIDLCHRFGRPVADKFAG